MLKTSSSDHSQNLPRIAIVGAGLAGLATAIFLRRSKLPVTIFEARPFDTADGGYLSLAPNAAYVLDQLGLYKTLLPQGFAYEEYTFLSGRNSSRIGVTLNGSVERYGYPALRISRHILRHELLQEAQRVGVQIEFERKLVGIEETDTGVSLAFASNSVQTATNTPTTGTQTHFDYLIGADGIHSRVRSLVFPSSPQPTFSGQIGLGGGQIPLSIIAPYSIPQPCLFIGSNNSFMMIPTAPDGSIVGISATIEVEERNREGWADLGTEKSVLKKMLVERHCDDTAPWPDVVQKCVQAADAESLNLWPFYNAPLLDSWTSSEAHSRIMLVGDAAHAMPPTGGQGAAMAFEDAASLSYVLSSCLASGHDKRHDDLPSVLQSWQSCRQTRVTKVKAFTSKGGDIRRASSSPLQQIIREWLMWAFFWVRGPEGGFSWIYRHREEGPHPGQESAK